MESSEEVLFRYESCGCIQSQNKFQHNPGSCRVIGGVIMMIGKH